MKKNTLAVFLLISAFVGVVAQTIFRTAPLISNIKTLQIRVNGQNFQLPIINLNSSDELKISFDEMSHDSHSYHYRVLYCNADWTQSDIAANEYLKGYTSTMVSDYSSSFNTTMLYTHYQITLPNNDMNFKISGNYAVIFYEDNQEDKPVACACFSVVDPRVQINAKIRGNTDTEFNGKLQQLDFDVFLKGYVIRDTEKELKVLVKQNNRYDNQVYGIQPTYITSDKLTFANNRDLIFEGGAEYRRFDISSVYTASVGVDKVRFNRPYYDAYLNEDKIVSDRAYMIDYDVNGCFVVNSQETSNIDTEAEYIFVHFNLPTDNPFFDGALYVGGEFNYNLFSDTNLMKYSADKSSYSTTILLKQGGYNYQYWFVPKGTSSATTKRVEGSHWQTKNEYTIYIYHRPFGERYDKLIAVKTLSSN